MPQFIAAWPDGLVEAWHEMYLEQRNEAMRFVCDFDEDDREPWTFWMTVEHVPRPSEIFDPIERISADA